MTGTITAVRARTVAASARGVWTFVEVAGSSELTGTGEGTVHLEPESVAPRLDGLWREILGKPARRSSLDWPAHGATDFTDVSARCALDQALIDIEAQAAGCSIARFLAEEWGARAELPRADVEVYANVNRRTADRSPAGFAASARRAVGAGFRAVKIAPLDGVRPEMSITTAGTLLDAAIERMAAVRDVIGRDCRLLVDCHWRLNPATAGHLLAAAAALDLFWIECPFPEDPADFADLRAFRTRANARGVRTAGCELLRGLDGFGPFIDGELYDVLMPDVKHAGGCEALHRVAEAAARRGIAIAPHNPTGPIAHAHSVQASAALPELLLLEMQFDETPAFESIVTGALPMPGRGIVAVPDATGLGLRLVAGDLSDGVAARE